MRIVNRDCLDIVVDFAAASVADCLVLRGVSQDLQAATHTHVQALVALDQPALSPYAYRRPSGEENLDGDDGTASRNPLRFCGLDTKLASSLMAVAVRFSADRSCAIEKLVVVSFNIALEPRPLLGIDIGAWWLLGAHPFAAEALQGCVEELALHRPALEILASLSLATARALRSLTVEVASVAVAEEVSLDQLLATVPVKSAVTTLTIRSSKTSHVALRNAAVEGFSGLWALELEMRSLVAPTCGTVAVASPLLSLLRQSSDTLESVASDEDLRTDRVNDVVQSALAACAGLTALKLRDDADLIACPPALRNRLAVVTSFESPDASPIIGRSVVAMSHFARLRVIALTYSDVSATETTSPLLRLPLVTTLHLDLQRPAEEGPQARTALRTPFAWVDGGLAAVFPALKHLRLKLSLNAIPANADGSQLDQAAATAPATTAASGCFADGPLVLSDLQLACLHVVAPSAGRLRLSDVVHEGLAGVSGTLEQLRVINAARVDGDSFVSCAKSAPLALPRLVQFEVHGLCDVGSDRARCLFGAMPRLESLSASSHKANDLHTVPTTLHFVRLHSLDVATATLLVKSCPRLRTVSLASLRPSDEVSLILAQGVKDAASGAWYTSPVATVHASAVGVTAGPHFGTPSWTFRRLHPRRGSWVATRTSTAPTATSAVWGRRD